MSATMLASLRETGKATFTLSPTISTEAGIFAVSGLFTVGSRFRLQVVRMYLIGATVETPIVDGVWRGHNNHQHAETLRRHSGRLRRQF